MPTAEELDQIRTAQDEPDDVNAVSTPVLTPAAQQQATPRIPRWREDVLNNPEFQKAPPELKQKMASRFMATIFILWTDWRTKF